MSKANQKFVQADEAVSPVIGVILMVAITVVLAAVVFVLVSNLSKTSDKSEDAAFTASSPVAREIHVTMIKMGANGPYEPHTDGSPDGVFINVNGVTCNSHNAATSEFSTNGFGADQQWGAGETVILRHTCDGDGTVVGTQFTSNEEYRIQVTVRGSLIFEGNVIVR